MKTFAIFFTALAICIASVKTILPQQSIPTPEGFLKSINKRMLLNGDYTLNNVLSYYNINTKLLPDKPEWDNWSVSDYTFQKWNGAVWINDSSEVYTYNEFSLLNEKLIRDWTASQWINQMKYLLTYNSSLSLSEDILQYYSGGLWIDSLKNIYSYNMLGQLFTVTTYEWNYSVWENYELMTSTYNNNQLVEDLFQVWNGSGWDNSGRDTYTYETNSVTITSAIWLFGGWINVLRIVVYYDNNGLLSEFKLQYWDFFSGWVNLTHLLFTYDSEFNIIEGLWQDWDTGTSSWVNYSKITSTYHSGNIPVNDLTELWNNNNWYYSALRTYDFDANFNLIQIINQNWNGSWLNNTRELFSYFTDVLDEQIYPFEFQLLQNYPNPFNPSTTIKYQIPEISFVILKIYDILGNEIKTLINEEKPAGTYEVEWNAGDFPSGIYFYQLKSNDFVETKKMILIK